ncbi:translocation and assembly module lipoprotein TamL [Flavicella sediminum]|uniref:translocation and assembly module lipoprotein TamL n=1 Tax=Flavicella sediminum TaxID=2585141 RepID=UPI001FB5F9D3|nr:BamA/TamA family outer membrane protein [Flavicella sediminum]
MDKIKNPLLKNNFKILVRLTVCSVLFITSCTSTKYVPKGDFLLSKNKIIVDGKNTVNTEVNDLIIQRPNQKSIGLPLSLFFYNFGNINYKEDHAKWIENNPKTSKFLNKVFSRKQTLKMGESYKDLHKWFLTKGEAPVIHDINKTEASVKKLRTYYFNQGYFDAEVTNEPDLGIKKITIEYAVTKNKPYFLNKTSTLIESQVADSIYNTHKDFSFLKEGDRYKDLNFRKEAKRLTNLYRNNGIYHFTENLIGFYEIDTASVDYKTDVLLKIANRVSEKSGKVYTHPLKIQTIKAINIIADYSYNKKDDVFQDSVSYQGYNFFSHDKLKYRPKALLNSIFIEPNDIYKDSARNLTRNHLKSLKNFKLVKVKYNELNDEELAATIILTPLKKYSIGLNTEAIHSNIKQLGFSGGFSFLNRNTFKGAEIFKLSFQGSIFDVSNNTGSDDTPFNSWEIGADASLEIPRFVFPFINNKLIPKRMGPKTVFSLGTSFQKNIGLDKQKFTGVIDVSWQATKRKKHTIEFINAQFVKNLNTDSYFDIYSSEYSKLKTIQETYFPSESISHLNALSFINNQIDNDFNNSNPDEYKIAKNIEKRHAILTTNYVSPSITYAFTYNTQSNFKDNSYFFFKAKIAASGNLTSAITQTRDGDVKTFLDIPIAQFVRTDFEFKKFWRTSSSSVLAYRSFLGVAIPYGNSDEIPFTNSYFIGGSNDIRAWKTYDLGPGSSNSGLEYNVSNFKFITSLEYRFDFSRSLKGALFVDAGNIWDITNSDLTTDEEKFTGLKSLENIAVGSGFGVRYDFNFLVLRLDLAFKTYEPYLTNNKWFQNYDLSNAVLNIGINYPF